MAIRLDSPLSCLRFLAYASYSSSVMATRLSRTSLRPYVYRTVRLSPLLVLLAPSSLPNDFTPFTFTRLDAIPVLSFYELYACLYLYLSDLYIYWVGDGMIPIFNLLCNHPSVVT